MRDPGRPETAGRPRVFYGWRLVLLATLVMAVGAVLRFDAVGVLVLPLSQEFGWSLALLSLGLTLPRLVALADPVVGYVTDRFGPRRTALTGLCILAGGSVFFGLMQNLWSFYAAFLIMTVGASLCGFIPLTVVISRWFVRRRATAIAISQMGPSLGAVVVVPVIGLILGVAGWRESIFMVAGVALVVALPVFALLRNGPEDTGLLPHGVPQAAQAVSFSIAQALRTPAFWLIAFGDAFTSVAVIAVMTFLGLLMTDKGFTVLDAGWVIAAYTGAAAVFGLASGYLGDRVSKRAALAVFALVQAAGVLTLVLANSLPMFFAFAVLFGAGFGGRGVLAVAILPDYFGTASLGKVLGFSAVFANILQLMGAPLAGFIWDLTGSFTLPSLVLAGLSLLGALFFLMARSPQPPDGGVGEVVK